LPRHTDFLNRPEVTYRYSTPEFFTYLPGSRLLLSRVSQELKQPGHILLPHEDRVLA